MTATTTTSSRAADVHTERRARRRRERTFAAACGTTVLLFAGVLAAAQVPLHNLLLGAALLAALLVSVVAVSLLAVALVVRRRLNELHHLPDLGRRFVTHHDQVSVIGMLLDPSGDLVLKVSSLVHHTVLLDEQGTPDRISPGGPTITRYRLHGSTQLDEAGLLVLGQLRDQDAPLTLMSDGFVTLLGPVPQSWRLQAGGLIVQSAA